MLNVERSISGNFNRGRNPYFEDRQSKITRRIRHTLHSTFGQYPGFFGQNQALVSTATSFRRYRCLPGFIFLQMYGCEKSIAWLLNDSHS